jgi:hypothetical protein
MTLAALLLIAASHYVTVSGLGGEPDYEQRFAAQAAEIDKIIRGPADVQARLLSGPQATKGALSDALAAIARDAKPDDTFVLTLIGHGTFDGTDYKFNLPGPDITAAELATLLGRIPARKQLIVNMTSASGASLSQLQKQGRIVIAATKSGMEKNATVFGRFWVEALRQAAADSDKNETISALEAFRFADKKTVEYYESQKRLATEHAVLEDTGDGEGVRAPSPENGKGQAAAQFAVLRLGSAQLQAATPEKASLYRKKEELELAIDKLKYQKAAIPADEYRKRMQGLLLDLARLQEEIDK